jgi:hypothetical protein
MLVTFYFLKADFISADEVGMIGIRCVMFSCFFAADESFNPLQFLRQLGLWLLAVTCRGSCWQDGQCFVLRVLYLAVPILVTGAEYTKQT